MVREIATCMLFEDEKRALNAFLFSPNTEDETLLGIGEGYLGEEALLRCGDRLRMISILKNEGCTLSGRKKFKNCWTVYGGWSLEELGSKWRSGGREGCCGIQGESSKSCTLTFSRI